MSGPIFLDAVALWVLSMLGENVVRATGAGLPSAFPMGGSGIGAGVASCVGGGFRDGNAPVCLAGNCCACFRYFGFPEIFQPGTVDRPVGLGASGWNYFARAGGAGDLVVPAFLAKTFAGAG